MRKSTREEFIKKAMEIHDDSYNYLDIIYVSCDVKIAIICPFHGQFKQIPSNHLRGQGCPVCAKLKRAEKRRFTKEDFIKKAIETHGSKYDYSKVEYTNNYTKIIIICPIHGKFEQIPRNHLQSQGCPICGLLKNSESRKLTREEFIKKAIEIHCNKYDYSKVEYINCYTKIVIICPFHGKFKQTSPNHLNGQGCPKCGLLKNSENRKLTKEEFIKKAMEYHENKYNYSKVEYIDYYTKVIIICPFHGKFKQIPRNHLCSKGCPRCNNSISKKEKDWLDKIGILENNRQKNIKINNKRFKVDGYEPKTKTIYEFYGDFWHGNPKIYNENDINPKNKKTYGELYNRTIERENILKSAGYNLIIIWESDYEELV